MPASAPFQTEVNDRCFLQNTTPARLFDFFVDKMYIYGIYIFEWMQIK